MSTLVAPRPRLHTSYRRLTPIHLVDRIEPCLDFWVDRLGFDVKLKVEDAGELKFVSLARDEVEVMFRTRDTMADHSPDFTDQEFAASNSMVLYLEVADLDPILERLEGADIVVPLRETLFGTREIFVRDPSGRIVALTAAA